MSSKVSFIVRGDIMILMQFEAYFYVIFVEKFVKRCNLLRDRCWYNQGWRILSSHYRKSKDS